MSYRDVPRLKLPTAVPKTLSLILQKTLDAGAKDGRSRA